MYIMAPDMARREDSTRPGDDFVSDEQLIYRYTQGRTSAFEELVRRYRRELYAFLARFLSDRILAEDIFQETFMQVHLSAGGFDTSRRLKPWLFTIAANKARDALRSRLRHPAAELDAPVGSDDGHTRRFIDLMPGSIPPPPANIENRELSESVQNIVRRMPENLRTALVLCYFHEFPYKDIADILGVPLGTVKSRLHVAVKDFARRWRATHGGTQDT